MNYPNYPLFHFSKEEIDENELPEKSLCLLFAM